MRNCTWHWTLEERRNRQDWDIKCTRWIQIFTQSCEAVWLCRRLRGYFWASSMCTEKLPLTIRQPRRRHGQLSVSRTHAHRTQWNRLATSRDLLLNVRHCDVIQWRLYQMASIGLSILFGQSRIQRGQGAIPPKLMPVWISCESSCRRDSVFRSWQWLNLSRIHQQGR